MSTDRILLDQNYQSVANEEPTTQTQGEKEREREREEYEETVTCISSLS